jgi:hypothetical protein
MAAFGQIEYGLYFAHPPLRPARNGAYSEVRRAVDERAVEVEQDELGAREAHGLARASSPHGGHGGAVIRAIEDGGAGHEGVGPRRGDAPDVRVKGDIVGAGRRELGDDPIDRLDHQMDIDGGIDPVAPERPAHAGPKVRFGT